MGINQCREFINLFSMRNRNRSFVQSPPSIRSQQPVPGPGPAGGSFIFRVPSLVSLHPAGATACMYLRIGKVGMLFIYFI